MGNGVGMIAPDGAVTVERMAEETSAAVPDYMFTSISSNAERMVIGRRWGDMVVISRDEGLVLIELLEAWLGIEDDLK